MIERAAVYDTATGAIRCVASGPPEALDLQPGPGEALIPILANEEVSDRSHYVALSLGVLVSRVSMPYTLTTAPGEARLAGLPRPCTLAVLGKRHTVEDGEALIRFDAPGVYTLELSAEPQYHATTVEVTLS